MKGFNVSNLIKLLEGVNSFDINIKYLRCNMFEKTPLGIRNKIGIDKPAFFLIFEDLVNSDIYPEVEKSGKQQENMATYRSSKF